MILTKENILKIDLNFLIEQKINSAKLNELLIIVPTNRKLRQLQREIITRSPNGSASQINIETLGSFVVKSLAFNNFKSISLLNETMASVLLKHSFKECKLNYFSSYKDEIPAGTLERVQNVISEYKRHGITPEQLEKETEHLEKAEALKAKDIINVYKIYSQKCQQLKTGEIGDLYSELISINEIEFSKVFRQIYPQVELIIVNGFDEFTSPEIEIINLSASVSRCKLFIKFDYFEQNTFIFNHLDKCVHGLIKKQFKIIQDSSLITDLTFHKAVKENLFHNKGRVDMEYKDFIIELRASNRQREIEIIAKEIKSIIIDEKIAPENICVVFNLIAKYSPLIRYTFSQYEIPINLTDRIPLSTCMPVVSIVNFLEILENDFYYRNIFRALNSSYINFEGVDLSNLLKVSIQLKIISGYDNWNNSIQTALKTGMNEYDDFTDTEREARILNKALNDINLIYEMLKPFFKNLSIIEFKSEFRKFIFSSGVLKHLLGGDDKNIELNVRGFNKFLSVVEELFEVLKLEEGSDKTFPLKYFLNNIRNAVSAARYNVHEIPGYGVQVTTLDEIRGLTFDYLFIAAMNDGDLPTKYSPEIFFSGSFRKKEEIHQTEERYRFYQALCSWRNKLYFSLSDSDDKAQLVESNFLSEFKQSFQIGKKDEAYYAPLIYSKQELLQLIGKNNSIDDEVIHYAKNTGINIKEMLEKIKADKERLQGVESNSVFGGNINSSISTEAKSKLESFKDNIYSTSQLETYAKCPFKYFAERVLKLEPPQKPSEDFEALEMGSLLHKILYEFYIKLTKQKIILAGCSEKNFQKAKKILFDTARQNISQANFKSFFSFYEQEKILGINGNEQNSILYQFLILERNFDTGFVPMFFETTFGVREKGDVTDKNSEIKIKAGSTTIRGKIDRIDINEKDGLFNIIDYKLGGKKPKTDELNQGLSLQIPLYMFAAAELIKSQLNIDMQPHRGYIYSLKFSEKDFGKKIVSLLRMAEKKSDDELINSNLEMINICIDAIDKYSLLISEGKFNLSTLEDRENKVCCYCNFRSICRIQEVDA